MFKGVRTSFKGGQRLVGDITGTHLLIVATGWILFWHGH